MIIKHVDLSMIIIYHVVSLLIFVVGFYLIYSNKQPSTFSSILYSLGWLLLRIIPFVILFFIAIESEFNVKANSLGEYLGNIDVYRNGLLILFFLSSIGIIAQIFAYSFNINNMQDPSAIPEFLRQQKCGALCIVDIRETFNISKGGYPLLDISNFIVSILVVLTPVILFISTLNSLSNLGLFDALIAASVRAIPVIIFAIFVLLGTFTNLKETVEYLIKDGYYGGIFMNLVNMGFFYFYFVIMVIIYQFISN